VFSKRHFQHFKIIFEGQWWWEWQLFTSHVTFLIRGGFHKAIYTLRLKFALYAHPFHKFTLIWHHVLHFFPDLGALFALCSGPNFYEIYPRSCINKTLLKYIESYFKTMSHRYFLRTKKEIFV
jgi:hypothetical protein